MKHLAISLLCLFVLPFQAIQACDFASIQPYFSSEKPLKTLQDSIIYATTEAFYLMLDGQLEDAQCLSMWALEKSNNISYTFGQAESKTRLGSIFQKKEDFQQALIYAREGLDLRRELMRKEASPLNSSRVASSLNNIALIHIYGGRVEDAFPLLEEGLQIVRVHPEWTDSMSSQYQRMLLQTQGEAYIQQGRPDAAMGSFLQSLALREPEDFFPAFTQSAEYELALLYSQLDYPEADSLFDKLERETKDDTAFFAMVLEARAQRLVDRGKNAVARNYYDKIQKLKASLRDTLGMGLNAYNLAVSFLNEGNLKAAKSYFLQAKDLYQQQNQERRLAEVLSSLGSVAQEEGKYEEAISYLSAAYRLAQKHAYTLESAEIASSLAEVFARTNQADSAYIYERRYREHKDLLSESEISATKIIEENRRKTLRVAQAEKEFRWLFVGGLIFLLGLASIFYLSYLNIDKKRKVARKEAEYQALQAKQNFEFMQVQQQGMMEERKRIGRNLHDHIAGDLIVIKREIESWADKVLKGEKAAEGHISEMMTDLEKTYQNVRELSQEMTENSREKLQIRQLFDQIKNRIEKDPSSQIEVEVYSVELAHPLEPDLKYQLFSIANEIAENARKSSGATKLSISLNQNEDGLNLIIEDNGKGFDLEKIESSPDTGIGIKNIKERVREIKGTLLIDTSPGHGTAYMIDFNP